MYGTFLYGFEPRGDLRQPVVHVIGSTHAYILDPGSRLRSAVAPELRRAEQSYRRPGHVHRTGQQHSRTGTRRQAIIDLDVVIQLDGLFPDAVQSLATLGYFHQRDLGVTGREVFDREDHDVTRDGTARTWASTSFR